jgi:nucleoside-diphosphate-sugar epimerase
MAKKGLRVAVTGPTGTFGHGLVPLLEADERVSGVVGVARRPFSPADLGWTKMESRQGDVRDAAALEEAFRGVAVVVHLAFLIVGGDRATTRAVNVEGTLNAFRAAAAAGARRFVYASSVAAYGFHDDNPVGMTEDWPVRPAERLFYSQEKAELEHLLEEEGARHPGLERYLLRPSIVVGPHTVGGKVRVPAFLEPLTRAIDGGSLRLPRRLPLPVPALVPDIPVQLVHEDDVGQALLQCVVAAGPPGAYNIAADDLLSMVDVAREVGVVPVPVPAGPAYAAARWAARLPLLPSVAQWVEAASHPAVMDTARAKAELHWSPRHSAIGSLREALGR